MVWPRGSIRPGNAGTRPRPRNTRGEATVCRCDAVQSWRRSSSARTRFSDAVSASTSEPDNHWYPSLPFSIPYPFKRSVLLVISRRPWHDTLEPHHAWKILDARMHRIPCRMPARKLAGALTEVQGRLDSAGPQLAPPGAPRMAKETDETMRKRKSF
jgi:hypothetical protein